MNLERIWIQLITYGPTKGSYKAEVTFNDERGKVELVLSPKLSDSLVKHIGKEVERFSAEAAAELAANIKQAVTVATIEAQPESPPRLR